MALTVNTNIASLNTQRNINNSSNALSNLNATAFNWQSH